MNRVAFGSTGEQVSRMCLGAMMFGPRCEQEEAGRIVDAAIGAGVTFIDTAGTYTDGQSEEILGRVLKGKRDQVFLGTKVNKRLSYDPPSIVSSVEASLRRLQTDRVDLLMIHWPKKGMDPEEIMKGLAQAVESGKARYVGCCNYPAWLFARHNAVAAANGWPKLVCNQIPYNPIERGVEVEILPQAIAEDIAVTVYRPLVMGLLSGKYRPCAPIPPDARGATDDRVRDWLSRFADGVRAVLDMAEEKGVTPAQLAIAWVASHPAVTCPIVGVSKLHQFQDSAQAFNVQLSPDERRAIADAFGAEVKEEVGGDFPGLRRELGLIKR